MLPAVAVVACGFDNVEKVDITVQVYVTPPIVPCIGILHTVDGSHPDDVKDVDSL